MPRMLNGSGVYPKDADALSHFKSHSQSLLPAACDSCPDPEESPLDGNTRAMTLPAINGGFDGVVAFLKGF